MYQSAFYHQPVDRAERLSGIKRFTVTWPESVTADGVGPFHCVALAVTGEVLSEAAIDLENYAGRELHTLACRAIRVV